MKRESKPSPDPRRVQDLREKAKQEANKSQPNSGATINTVLYGAHTENERAVGTGEFEQ